MDASKRLCTKQDIANFHKLTLGYMRMFLLVLPLALWGMILSMGVSSGISSYFCKDAWKKSEV